MAMYTLNLLAIAMELAKEEPAYEDVASKFWEHFVYIAHAMSHRGHDGMGLWNEEDGFFYDVLKLPNGTHFPMKIRSMVGLIPLFAVETLEPEVLDRLPDFKRRLNWFIENRPDLTENVACMKTPGRGERRLLSIASKDQLRSILRYMLDESGRRPVFGDLEKFQTDPHWRDLVLFHEYFHGDSGAGVGASHQTGWTGIVTKLMQQSGEFDKKNATSESAASVAAD